MSPQPISTSGTSATKRGCDSNALDQSQPWFRDCRDAVRSTCARRASACLFSAHRQRILGKPTGTSATPVWTVIGWQTAVVSRHAQMMPAIGRPRHRVAAAELRRDLVHVAERPAALAGVEFKQRATPHIWRRHGGIDRWRRLCRLDRCYRCLSATRPRLHRRVHLEMFFHVGWQQIIPAQPHCLSAYRRARAVQLLRDLRG